MSYSSASAMYDPTVKKGGNTMSSDQLDVLGDSTLLSGLVLVLVAIFVIIAFFRPIGKMHDLEYAYEGLGPAANEWLRYVRVDDSLQTLLVFGGILLTAAFCTVAFPDLKNRRARYVIFAIVAVLSIIALALRYLAPSYIRFIFIAFTFLYVMFAALTMYLAYKCYQANKTSGVAALGLVSLVYIGMAVGSVSVAFSYDAALVQNGGGIDFAPYTSSI